VPARQSWVSLLVLGGLELEVELVHAAELRLGLHEPHASADRGDDKASGDLVHELGLGGLSSSSGKAAGTSHAGGDTGHKRVHF